MSSVPRFPGLEQFASHQRFELASLVRIAFRRYVSEVVVTQNLDSLFENVGCELCVMDTLCVFWHNDLR